MIFTKACQSFRGLRKVCWNLPAFLRNCFTAPGASDRIMDWRRRLTPVRRRFVMEFYVDGLVHDWDAQALFLERRDFFFVDERQANVVKTLEQAIAAEGIDGEGTAQAAIVGDDLVFEIDGEAVALVLLRAREKLVHLLVRQRDRQNPVLEAIVVEDVGVARRENRAEAVIENGPGSVFAAGAATEIRSRKDDAGALVARSVQDEIGMGFLARQVAPIVEE